MKKACFFFVKGITGGTATLSYRLGLSLIIKGYDVYYIKELDNNAKNETLMVDNGIHVITEPEQSWYIRACQLVQEYEEVILLTYVYNYFHILEKLKYRYRNKRISTFVYSALPDCLIVGYRWKHKYPTVYKLLNTLSKSYVKELCNNRQVLFQEEAGIQLIKNELHFGVPDSEKQIYRIPHDVPKYLDSSIHKMPVIVSMARVEFPFKGYLIGLIDVFYNLKNNYPYLKLYIIGNGPSMKELKDKVNKLPDNIKQDIQLCGSMNYTQALELLHNCKLFVGMGTGVLDAVSVSTPAIAVQCHTYECVCKGLFVDFPRDVGYYSNTGLHSVECEIEKILGMDERKYQMLTTQGIKIIEEMYSSHSFVNRLVMLQNYDKRISVISRITRSLCMFILRIYHLFFRVDWNSFDNN